MNLDYTIKRSARRRTLTITVERDRSVVVHVPMDMTEEKVRETVERKRQWIYEKKHHLQKYHDLPHPPGKELVSGESVLYLGRQCRIEIIQTEQVEVQFAQRLFIPAGPKEQQLLALRNWYIMRANEKIIPRVSHHARELGVAVNQIRIVDNRYRWGSCTPKDNVHINWQLIKAPMFVIDYVIVHELAHLIEANHTSRFWNIVKARIAQVDKAKDWLKQHGQLLE